MELTERYTYFHRILHTFESGHRSRLANCSNYYFADCFVLSSSTEKYFAVASKAGGDKGEIMRMRSGLAITRQNSYGLWQSFDGGSNFFRASPLVFVLHYKWSGSSWNYDGENSWAASSQYGQSLAPSYSPNTKMLTISYKGLSIPHVQAQYICRYAWYHLQVYSQTATEMQLRIINQNGTVMAPYDTNDELYIFGFRVK